MNFKYYDLLSNLVPGLLIYAVANYYMKAVIPDLSVVPLLAIAFVIGYFNNTISAWMEDFYRIIMGGNHVNKFFDKNGIWKVRFFRGSEVKQVLIEKIGNQSATNSQLFLEAMKIANLKTTNRLEDLNANYAFSRGIVTTILITGSMVIYFNYTNVWAYIGIVILFIVSLFRCHQRNAYYIREVLNIVLSSIDK